MSRRTALALACWALVGAALAGCGRRGRLRLPERDGEERAPDPAPAPPARSAPNRRSPSPAGLETG